MDKIESRDPALDQPKPLFPDLDTSVNAMRATNTG
jgi:hypothetical protein